ncbi:hypothetical protein [Candidatus Protochlamydia sp. W-9]|uniref:hypothetical protein n=1 Tax=Candidatus Protochlamydia sp. W-9 TaxID=1785087 RepID=UPI00096A37D3|nr:hypothetical protein [Candidatus Protochlamydia sp. W-9]
MNNPSVGYGFSNSPTSPDYNDLNALSKSQTLTNSKMKQGAPTNPGVILTEDSLEVPLEVAFGINIDRASAGRPTLSPLFRSRFADENNQTENLALSYYQSRFEGLPFELQARLTLDKQKEFEDRDPDLLALDASLKFDAQLLAFRDSFSVSKTDESIQIAAQQYLGLPDAIGQEMIKTSGAITNFLDDHLSQIGPNDPDYDRLLNVSNLIKETTYLLKLKDMSD